MSVYYQTSPPTTPPRAYYVPGSHRGSGYYGRGSLYGGSEYARPYNEYTIPQPASQYNYYAPNSGYYQPQVMALAQPRYTMPMVYNYLAPRSRLHRLYRGRQYYNYAYQDDGCCGCGGTSGRSRRGGCCGDDGRYDTYGYGGEDDCCGCCGCCGSGQNGAYYYPRRRHRRDDDCC